MADPANLRPSQAVHIPVLTFPTRKAENAVKLELVRCPGDRVLATQV